MKWRKAGGSDGVVMVGHGAALIHLLLHALVSAQLGRGLEASLTL